MENHNHSSPTYSVNIHSFNIIRVYTYHCLKLRILCYSTALTSNGASTHVKDLSCYPQFGHMLSNSIASSRRPKKN